MKEIPREYRTSTDERRLFGRILCVPQPYSYRKLTFSGPIKQLIRTKELNVVDMALWLENVIPSSTKEVTYTPVAREVARNERAGTPRQ